MYKYTCMVLLWQLPIKKTGRKIGYKGSIYAQMLYRSPPSISEWWTLLLQVKALGCDGSSSLSSWLENLGLHEYLHNFLTSGYRTLDCVKNLWELEIVNVSHSDVHALWGVSEGEISFSRALKKIQDKWTSLTGYSLASVLGGRELKLWRKIHRTLVLNIGE